MQRFLYAKITLYKIKHFCRNIFSEKTISYFSNKKSVSFVITTQIQVALFASLCVVFAYLYKNIRVISVKNYTYMKSNILGEPHKLGTISSWTGVVTDLKKKAQEVYSENNFNFIASKSKPLEGFKMLDKNIKSRINAIKDYINKDKTLNNILNLQPKEIKDPFVLARLLDSGMIIKPMKTYSITDKFGMRKDPLNLSKHRMHYGIDFVSRNKNNKIIHATSSGSVVFAGQTPDLGNNIIIDHGFNIQTRYGHLSKIDVKFGDVVSRGDRIGVQGNTGKRCAGEHLHYEVIFNKSKIDPMSIINLKI